jgi:hypothetical protein
VDDPVWSTSIWTNVVDANSTFVIDQAACDALAIDETALENNIRIYPNPANDVINITNDNEEPITSMQLFNVMGESIYYSDKFQRAINTSKLKAGLYLLEIKSKAGSITKKIQISK